MLMSPRAVLHIFLSLAILLNSLNLDADFLDREVGYVVSGTSLIGPALLRLLSKTTLCR